MRPRLRTHGLGLSGAEMEALKGWSTGLSRLPLGEITRITALDVHPALYYLLLKGWLTLRPHEFVIRFLSVLAGVLSVPLAYQAGRPWRDAPVDLLAALYTALLSRTCWPPPAGHRLQVRDVNPLIPSGG